MNALLSIGNADITIKPRLAGASLGRRRSKAWLAEDGLRPSPAFDDDDAAEDNDDDDDAEYRQ